MLRNLLLAILLITGMASAADRVFELRTYTANEGKMDGLIARFRDHTTRIFKEHNMEVIGYWRPQDPEKAKNTITYILAHPSREAATRNWAEFMADPEWVKVAEDSQRDGRLVQKIDSVFMDPFPFSPLK